MVKLGYPFFSVFPEEIVLTSIFNKEEYKHALNFNPVLFKLLTFETKLTKKEAAEQGYYLFFSVYNET
jgi:hypothetical protein